MEGLSLLLESLSNCISPLGNLSIPTDLFRRKATLGKRGNIGNGKGSGVAMGGNHGGIGSSLHAQHH